MNSTETAAAPEAPPAAPAAAPSGKKEVSQEVLDRLKKAREALEAKRAALAEQRELAKAHLEQQKAAPPPPKKVKTKAAAPPKVEVSSDDQSDSSTDSSDTSDSEVDEPRKRGTRKERVIKNKRDYKAELDRAKAKYQNRYKARYELMVRNRYEPEPAVNVRKPVHGPTASQEAPADFVKRGAKSIAKADVQQALQKEMMAATIRNLFRE